MMRHDGPVAHGCRIPVALQGVDVTLWAISSSAAPKSPNVLAVESFCPLSAAGGEVAVRAAADFSMQEALCLIDADELARAERFLNAADRDVYIMAHGCLRKVIGRWLGAAPETLRFGKSHYGKPELHHPHTQLKFNLSHSGSFIAVVTADRDVGVDIEARESLAFAQIARRFFAEEEQDYVFSGDRAGMHERFYYIWVRKEALLKAVGIGLRDIAKTAVLADRVEMKLANGETTHYSIRTLHSGAESALAVAIRD